jgi:hypothetical protein
MRHTWRQRLLLHGLHSKTHPLLVHTFRLGPLLVHYALFLGLLRRVGEVANEVFGVVPFLLAWDLVADVHGHW